MVLPFTPTPAPSLRRNDESERQETFDRQMAILRVQRPMTARIVEQMVDRLIRKYGLSA